jgi:hypothetical protein
MLPAPVADLLIATVRAEKAATGARRRVAFAVTRYLFAGAAANGVSLAAVATLLGRGSVYNRAGIDGIVLAEEFSALSGIPLDRIKGWDDAGILPAVTTDAAHRTGYPASALIRALLMTRNSPASEPDHHVDAPAVRRSDHGVPVP